MKKILFILILGLVSLFSSGQVLQPNVMVNFQQFGSPTTWSRINGIIYPVFGFVNSTYTDTSSANLTQIKNSPGAQIFTIKDTSIWLRNVQATRWMQLYTVSNIAVGSSGSPSDTVIWRVSGTGQTIINSLGGGGIGTANSVPLWFITGGDIRIQLPSNGIILSNDTSLNKVMTFNPITKNLGYSNWNSTSSGTIDSTLMASRYWVGKNAWGLTGNTNTDSSKNFIGTTDNKSLLFKLNNEPAGFIHAGVNDSVHISNSGIIMGLYAGEYLIKDFMSGAKLHPEGNTLYGYQAGRNLGRDWGNVGTYKSDANVFIGNAAGDFTQVTNGLGGQYGRNSIIGYNGLIRNVSGSDNSGTGAFVLEMNVDGDGNSAFGRDALRSTVSGDFNSGLGIMALAWQTTGVDSCLITNGGSGYTTATVTFSAPYTVGNPGTCNSVATGTAIIQGGSIVGITITNPGCGYCERIRNFHRDWKTPVNTVTITGDGVGATAIPVLASASFNTGVGISSGLFQRMGSHNLYAGNLAGSSYRFKDDYMTFLGSYSDVDGTVLPQTRLQKSVAIGYNAKVGASNTMALGGTGIDAIKVAIGKTTAMSELDVKGVVTINHKNSYLSLRNVDHKYLQAFDSSGYSIFQIRSYKADPIAFGSFYASLYFGDSAGYNMPYGWNNTVMGSKALYSATWGVGGNNITAMGAGALEKLTIGASVTAIGTSSLPKATNVNWTTAIGQASAYAFETGQDDIFVGQASGGGFKSGNFNIFIGTTSGAVQEGRTGNNNTNVGYNTGISNTGSSNLFLGSFSGSAVTFGNYNVIIGGNNGSSITTANNQMILSDGEGNLRMKLDSAGDVRIPGDVVTVNNEADTLATKADVRAGGGGATPVATLATFGAGARMAGDTAAFTDSTIYGSFYWDGSDTLIITKVRAVMNGGTNDTLGYNIYYNDSINVIGSKVFTATEPVTSTTTGADANADNYINGGPPVKIPPGNWVWLKTPTVVAGRKPYYFSVSIIGYKKRVY